MPKYRMLEADSPELRRLPWARIEAEGLAQAVLWDRLEPTVLDWLEVASPRTSFVGLGFDDSRGGELIGALWLLPAGLSATVHFVVFHDWQADQENVGRTAVDWIFQHWRFQSLLATYPAPYRHLHRFMKALGFTPWPHRLKAACHMPVRGNLDRCRDMAFASLTRKDFLEGKKQWAEL